MSERIQKLISEAGLMSRRAAEQAIISGRVLLNGLPAVLGDKADMETDEILVDGEKLALSEKKRYLMLNKPKGYVTSMHDEKGRRCVEELVRGAGVRVYPVGRLDKDSEGLILLTNDGELMNEILRARNYHEKEYEVRVDRPVTKEFLDKMSRGVEILDTVTRPCQVHQTGVCSFRIILTQGLNRQIRRMCEALGYRVRHLRRYRIMNIHLGDLESGKYRELTEKEYRELQDLIGKKGGAGS